MAADSLPLISAVFLAKFDVHSGYQLEWSKSNSNEVYNLKDVEFSALPSGLHSVDSDTVLFVHKKGKRAEQTGKDGSELLYCMSVFKQNKLVKKKTIDRSQIKLYSLGIIIDPEHTSAWQSTSFDLPWKPKIYSACWQYRESLNRMLGRFMECHDSMEEQNFYSNFDRFFELHRFRVPYESEAGLKPHPGLQSMDIPGIGKMDNPDDLGDDHMILGLLDMVKKLGPLLYKAWKMSLLRKRIVFYMEPKGSIVSLQEDNIQGLKIGDISRFIYCLSLISSIPKGLKSTLSRSGVKDIDDTLFHTPIYNVCLTDMSNMEITDSFIASTTDEIILEKPQLYDYCIKFDGEEPRMFDSASRQLYAGHRDFEAFNRVISKTDLLAYSSPSLTSGLQSMSSQESFGSEVSGSTNNSMAVIDTATTVEEDTEDTKHVDMARYGKMCDRASIREMLWRAIAWWATAGTFAKELAEQFSAEDECFDDIADSDQVTDRIDIIIALVGYFQKLTSRLMNGLSDVVLNSVCDASNEDSTSNATVWIQPQDVYEMGLDPFNNGDCEFLIELVEVWWGKKAKIGGECCNLCCL